MSLNRLWLFLAVALPVLAAVIAPMSTVDLTYQLRAGAEIVATGAIPVVDSWTFTAAGEPWVDQQWGAQVVLALVEGAGSWSGLVLFRAVLTGTVFASLLVVARNRGLDARTTTLIVLVAFVVAAPAMALRPQLLGMACFAVVLVLVADRRAHPGRLWLVPAIVLVWANLHGSFFLGPVVLLLAWLEDVHDRHPGARRTLAVAVASGIAACVTPSGPAVWLYAIGLSANPAVTARITEWQPTTIREVPGLVFFASVAAVVLLLARRGRVAPWPTLAWFAVFVLIGLYAQRGIAWWPLAAVVAVTGLLGPSPSTPARAEPAAVRRLNLVIAGTLALVGILLLPMWRPLDPGTRTPAGVLTDAPSGITAALREVTKPGDRVFNPQPWGSWFEYALPDRRYAIDSRIEFFPTAVWQRYEAIASGAPGWETALGALEPDAAVVPASDASLRDRLVRCGGWRVAYDDAEGSILLRPLVGASRPVPLECTSSSVQDADGRAGAERAIGQTSGASADSKIVNQFTLITGEARSIVTTAAA